MDVHMQLEMHTVSCASTLDGTPEHPANVPEPAFEILTRRQDQFLSASPVRFVTAAGFNRLGMGGSGHGAGELETGFFPFGGLADVHQLAIRDGLGA